MEKQTWFQRWPHQRWATQKWPSDLFLKGRGRAEIPPPPHHERYVNYAIIAIYCARPIGKDYCRQLLCLLISCSQEQTNHAADTNPCLLPHS